ncbi:hypothetical protein [Paenibacillus sp. LK1]|uniref:hypothetical protein n=1 Tax=Paenibacillus sp. LK1 TaxID=2053014 RepID=UPI000C17FC70|nr:hypothetical protein [Paenibacillus sp. LK1]PIH59142.1 hypothetical protein CS562_14480 [Paenibacillus sp. LK1]
MRRIYLRFLMLVSSSFIIYGIVVIFAGITVSPFFSAVITILSFIVSLMVLLFTLLKKVTSKMHKSVVVFAILLMLAVIAKLLYLLFTRKLDEELDLNLLSNYSTIVAFGVSLIPLVLDGSNNSGRQMYVSLSGDKKVILRKQKF